MADVAPLPLDGDEDFFSDFGSEDTTSPPRLVINHSNNDVQQRATYDRANPFSVNSNQIASDTSEALHHRNKGQSQTQGESDSEEIRNRLSTNHCHVPHKHDSENTVRNQLIAISVVTLMFMIGEAIGAILSGSVALGTDVAHLASDLLSFIFSLIAIQFAKKSATKRFTWGFYRGEVLGALTSVFIIWIVTGILVYVAVKRVIENDYSTLKPKDMLIVAICSVVFNVIMGVILNVEIFKCKVSHGHSHGGSAGHSHGASSGHSHMVRMNGRRRRCHADGHERLTPNADDTDDEPEDSDDVSAADASSESKEKNIMIRAAFIHVIGDLIQSVGVLIAAVVIFVLGVDKAGIADPICTFVFSILVLITTVTVLRDSFLILMEGCPRSISYNKLYFELSQLSGVKSVHSLKVWALTSNEITASVHLAVDDSVTHPHELTVKANHILRLDGLINSTTVQVEPYDATGMENCSECNNSELSFSSYPPSA